MRSVRLREVRHSVLRLRLFIISRLTTESELSFEKTELFLYGWYGEQPVQSFNVDKCMNEGILFQFLLLAEKKGSEAAGVF